MDSDNFSLLPFYKMCIRDSCYNSMFYDCTSLTDAPELKATKLANGCYDNMLDVYKRQSVEKMAHSACVARTLMELQQAFHNTLPSSLLLPM